MKANIKYVCTTGKSFNSIDMIGKLYQLGMSTVRFNMSYREKCLIDEFIPIINDFNYTNNYDLKTMVDLGGPEIRIDIEEPLEVLKNNIYIIGKDIKVKAGDISILDVNDVIIFGDGEIKFRVLEKCGDSLKCISLNNGTLKRNKKITNEKLCKTIPFCFNFSIKIYAISSQLHTKAVGISYGSSRSINKSSSNI